MFEIICICVTVIVCVWIISNAHWKITLNSHVHTETPQPNITEEQLKAAYDELEKDPVPDFADVINYINTEFGGLDADE